MDHRDWSESSPEDHEHIIRFTLNFKPLFEVAEAQKTPSWVKNGRVS